MLNSGRGVLDVAGGSGHLSMALALRGIRATVLDPRSNVGKLPKRDRKLFVRAQQQRQVQLNHGLDDNVTENEDSNSNQREDVKATERKQKTLWKTLLYPSLSSPKAPPPQVESSPTTMENTSSDTAVDNRTKNIQDTKLDGRVMAGTERTRTEDAMDPQTNTTMASAFEEMELPSYYYCQPVQPYDAYRAWFGGLPPEPRATSSSTKFNSTQTRSLPLPPQPPKLQKQRQQEDSMKRSPPDDKDSLPISNEEDPLFQQASALVALHPDEATDAIVDLAVAHEIPFVIVPCCVYSRLFPHRRKTVGTASSELVCTLPDLVEYLQAKHPSIQRATLPFEGANTVLWSTFGLKRYEQTLKQNLL